MSYDYIAQKPRLWTEGGQVMFTKIRDAARDLCAKAGAVSSGKLFGVTGGDTWDMLACVDRLVELAELREITDPKKVAGQDRIFVWVNRSA